MKQKRIIGIIIIITLIIGFCIYHIIDKNGELTEYQTVFLKDSKKVEEAMVFTSKEKLSDFIEEDTTLKLDFKNHNYVLAPIHYNSCGKYDVTVNSYKIRGNILKIKMDYKESCGYCAEIWNYYLIEVNKDTKDMKTKVSFHAIKKEKCDNDTSIKKPIIYLYPIEETKVEVTLSNSNLLTTSYPKYHDNWKVTAYPDGTLIDENGRKYYGLYWEGKNHKKDIKEEGFVVKGDETVPFLEEKLEILGLTEKEANEFIIYWLPVLEKNHYNYYYFETLEEMNQYMNVSITPKPDTIIRITMNYKPLKEKIEVKEQTLSTVERKGFTVVEWGGSEIK